MKITEGKHNHNFTKLLKVCLFGLIMILPFLAMLPTTLYFAFNEHAQNYTYQSVTEAYEYETNEVNSVNDLVEGNIYKYTNYQSIPGTLYTKSIYFLERPNLPKSDWYAYENSYFLITANNCIYYENNIQIVNFSIPNNSIFYFVYGNSFDDIGISNISASDYLGEKSVTITESEQSPMTAFNTVSTVIWQSPVFNWVNSGLGSIAIANMLTVFGIAKNTFISNILIYWLSITAIYIVIDIVITAFTILTHLFSKKAE